ncbi:uncharacterized protein LOC112084384 [Eutrema salsugineum]|uniref:uncharacterized protein LOC112084384 n=1 Tax=Eutrema salsugineum TaxID=72664 RepID=UPI000CED2D8E|nr:uncharacterized protein LOC112084384 [Eutrema salsugineum]
MRAVNPVGVLPEKFDGTKFKMWQKKMFFYLATLKLEKYTREEKPILPSDNDDAYALASKLAWEHRDFLCKGYIQSRLADALFNVYSNVETSKELWDSLDKKYCTKDAGSHKYAVAKFQDYKIVDLRQIIDQVGELQTLLHEIHAEGMRLCETYQVACIIEKLPSNWTVFKNYLKLKKKWMSLEDLTIKLRCYNKGRQDKGKGKVPPHNSQKFKKKKSGGGESSQKFTGTCHNCGKTGQKSFECRSKKALRKNESNLAYPDMCAMITEANVAESHPKIWWFDTGATRHICLDRSMFSAYTKNKSDEKIFMGNSAT